MINVTQFGLPLDKNLYTLSSLAFVTDENDLVIEHNTSYGDGFTFNTGSTGF